MSVKWHHKEITRQIKEVDCPSEQLASSFHQIRIIRKGLYCIKRDRKDVIRRCDVRSWVEGWFGEISCKGHFWLKWENLEYVLSIRSIYWHGKVEIIDWKKTGYKTQYVCEQYENIFCEQNTYVCIRRRERIWTKCYSDDFWVCQKCFTFCFCWFYIF